MEKTKIMASSPIISWQTDGEATETVTDLIFLGSKITADDDCSHETKRCFLLGRKAMTNLDSILKSRDIILLTQGNDNYSSTLAWKIPWREEPGRLQSMKSHRVGHD